MERRQNPLELVNALNDLLQQAHFDARELQQYAPGQDRESVPDQIHRIRMLALQLRTLLAAHETPA